MFCSRCGSEITGKSKFCPSCGLDLMATTPVHAIATGALEETDLVREALAAEYEIIEELGRGGMAMVYRARDRHLEREVAIKVLPFSLAFDSEFVERFQREARTAAQLEHPNIISIYRVGRAGRVIYFVMKFLRGGSVATVLAERRKLMPPEIRRLLIEAGSALGYAAQRGIVHRDIKPDNIMFDEFGHVRADRLRHRQGGVGAAAHGHRDVHRHAALHEPGAGPRPVHRRPERHLQPRRGGVPGAHRHGAVRRRGQLLDRLQAHHRAGAHAAADHRRRAPSLRGDQADADEGPGDRFQSCEELVASLQGQPIAAAGSLRASLATAGVGSGIAPTRPSPALGAPALIVSQPTTPIESPLVNRRQTPSERRDNRRRVADRSVAMRRTSGSAGLGWLWLVLAIAGGVGGAFYYYRSAASPRSPPWWATRPPRADRLAAAGQRRRRHAVTGRTRSRAGPGTRTG